MGGLDSRYLLSPVSEKQLVAPVDRSQLSQPRIRARRSPTCLTSPWISFHSLIFRSASPATPWTSR
jgi:hypothetical protein